ncbi:hypothetical protein ANO11243_001220 [Dothideomycetidae sp. 11243]|nr:hypothetical protein ANO11243_001220 [fungal sp. No.11243]
MLASGFTNAPLSRTLLSAVVVLSVLASITDTKYYFWIAIKSHLFEHRQYWRMLTWQLCYTNSTEVLFAAMTLYQLRVIERLWGTRKFGVRLVSGPTAIIFALLAQYHAAIPYLYKYQVSATDTMRPDAGTSLMLTSKSTSYLLPAQLALSQFPGSAIAALIGWVVGVAYRRELLPGGASRWRFPDMASKRAERDRYEGLRRRMEGDAATASGTDAGDAAAGHGRRRGVARAILDQFRGAF